VVRDTKTKSGSILTLLAWRPISLSYIAWWVVMITGLVFFWLRSEFIILLIISALMAITFMRLIATLNYKIEFRGEDVIVSGKKDHHSNVGDFVVERHEDVDGIDDERGTLALYVTHKDEKRFLTFLSQSYDMSDLENTLNERLKQCSQQNA